MMDSPVGVAAWIVEKFHAWSDLRPAAGWTTSIRRTGSLDNVMVYLVTRSFNTATWLYYGHRESGERLLPEGGRVEAPTGVAAFPVEFVPWPPRSYAETAYNIVHWTDMPRGGHFAAMEAPQLLVADIRAFARPLRADWRDHRRDEPQCALARRTGEPRAFSHSRAARSPRAPSTRKTRAENTRSGCGGSRAHRPPAPVPAAPTRRRRN